MNYARARRGAGWVLALAGIAGFAVAATWSLRAGWADYQAGKETLAGTEAALRWMPDQSEYHFRLSMLTADRDPARSLEALKHALALNPADARAWIELGLRREAAGDMAEAERTLLRAAGEDRQYLPRWTLANYYLRRDEIPRFWFWAKAAAEMTYGDSSALFRLCARVAEDGNLIDRLEITRPEIRAGYLLYLLNERRDDVILPAVRKVLEGGQEADVPLLLMACDRLLDQARVDEAMEVWNSLSQARCIPFGRLDPATGQVLTGGRFETAPISSGFDWRLPSLDGVSASVEDRGGLRLTFAGSQPEDCEVLAQLIPVRENAGYELGFVYRTSGIAANAGLGWRLSDARSGAILMETGSLFSEDDSRAGVKFRTPAGCRLVRLSLRYRRTPGTTRMAGFVILREVAVRPAS